jgi:hypothetical protein
MPSLIIGIDPGTHTGWAVWDRDQKRMIDMASLTHVEAVVRLQIACNAGSVALVVYEDATKHGRSDKSPEAALGAGSIRRESGIWREWLEFLGVPYRAISPRQKGAKLSQHQFVRLTGRAGRTSQHARDAAMLIWGM